MKKLLFAVFGVVLLLIIYKINVQKHPPTPVNSLNVTSEWITTDFKNIYAVNISYPKNWTLNCCGDTEAGTFHDLYYKPIDGTPLKHILLQETFGYSDNLEGPITDPQTYYKNDITSGKLKKIDDVTTANLGTSVVAFSQEIEMSGVPPTFSKTYIFQIPGRNENPLYYIVRFSSVNEFSEEFIQTFLNRLTLAR